MTAKRAQSVGVSAVRASTRLEMAASNRERSKRRRVARAMSASRVQEVTCGVEVDPGRSRGPTCSADSHVVEPTRRVCRSRLFTTTPPNRLTARVMRVRHRARKGGRLGVATGRPGCGGVAPGAGSGIDPS